MASFTHFGMNERKEVIVNDSMLTVVMLVKSEGLRSQSFGGEDALMMLDGRTIVDTLGKYYSSVEHIVRKTILTYWLKKGSLSAVEYETIDNEFSISFWLTVEFVEFVSRHSTYVPYHNLI